MDKKELMAAIDRVRRVMGRNADVMLICDYAQGELTRPILQSAQVEPNEATAPAARGGARPGAGRKPTGKAPMTAAERSKRHREAKELVLASRYKTARPAEAKDTSVTPSSEGWPLIGER